jgi:hypothetical protein
LEKQTSNNNNNNSRNIKNLKNNKNGKSISIDDIREPKKLKGGCC